MTNEGPYREPGTITPILRVRGQVVKIVGIVSLALCAMFAMCVKSGTCDGACDGACTPSGSTFVHQCEISCGNRGVARAEFDATKARATCVCRGSEEP